MNPIVGLLVFLVLYASVGALFAFNVWSLSDRAAEHFRGYPWLLRQIGRDNPLALRSGGLIMLAFGAIMIAGIVVLGWWQLPHISTSVAILVLVVTAITCLVVLVRSRRN